MERKEVVGIENSYQGLVLIDADLQVRRDQYSLTKEVKNKGSAHLMITL